MEVEGPKGTQALEVESRGGGFRLPFTPEAPGEYRVRLALPSGAVEGRFTAQEAKDLALLIRAGALPVPVEVVEQRTVGPSLGEAAIRASVQAALIGAALTILYMVAYYRLLGGLAAAALLIYGLLSFAVLLLLEATLTLPGVAGFVLAIGMAVDANVLVFERIKEEHAAGQRIGSAVTAGFKRAWSAIADSNATTILAAALLFFLASGAVRGFGITVTIGVAVSMFTALVVTRILVEVAIRPAAVRTRPTFLGMGVGSGFRRWLEERSPDLLGRSRIWFTVSAVVLALAMALMTQAPVILLDEPTAGVHPALIQELVAQIRALNAEGRTFVVIEHHMEVVNALAHRVYFLAGGRVLAEGTPEAVRQDPQVLHAYYGH
uniref:Protein translocase subunit SecD n=1 Tax=Thermus islandicus TaxID=540988 RepID=A0A7C2C3Z8_9DEIN